MTSNNAHTEKHFARPLSGAVVTELPRAMVPPRSVFEGRYSQLEPLDPQAHAQSLFDASHGDEQRLAIWDYLAYGPYASAQDHAAALRAQAASLDTIFYAVRSLESGEICGQTSFLDMNPQTGVIEIGHIWFAPVLQRTRAATESLYLMLNVAMQDLKYRRMQWRCNALNAKSRGAARRLGFRFEGVFYNHMIFKGKNRDTAWYSILDDEWPEVKTALETWLAPQNFDEHGVAKSSLSEAMSKRGPSTRPTG